MTRVKYRISDSYLADAYYTWWSYCDRRVVQSMGGGIGLDQVTMVRILIRIRDQNENH
jgi:hypothetical protein